MVYSYRFVISRSKRMKLIKNILLKVKSLFSKISQFYVVKNKKVFYTLTSLFLIVGVFAALNAAQADIKGEIASILGWLISVPAFLIGLLMLQFSKLLVWIASFNEFVTLDPIRNSWIIIRDACNLFFIFILLVIAVATTLNIERYSYKKALPKLLLMIVLINFSLIICGVLIDISQVVTITIVNAWGQAGNNLVNMFKVPTMLSSSELERIQVDNFTTVMAMLLSLILMIVALVVVLIIIFVFLLRAVAFWILIILSPVAFLAGSASFGEKYYKQWWDEFTKYLLVGPILAFFLWVSMVVASSGVALIKMDESVVAASPGVLYTQITQPENLAGFLLAICLLVGSLIATQKLGVAGAGMAGKGVAGLKKAGVGALKYAPGLRAAREYATDTYKGIREGLAKPREEKRKDRVRDISKTTMGAMETVKKTLASSPADIGRRWKQRGRESKLSDLNNQKADINQIDYLEGFKDTKKEFMSLRRKRDTAEKERNEAYESGASESVIKEKMEAVKKAQEAVDKQKKVYENQRSFINSEKFTGLEDIDIGELSDAKLLSEVNNRRREYSSKYDTPADFDADTERAFIDEKEKDIRDEYQKTQKVLDQKPPKRKIPFTNLALIDYGKWGKMERKSIAGYTSGKVKDNEDELKLEEKEKVKEMIKDDSNDKYTRMAAINTTVKNKYATADEILEYRDLMKELSEGDKTSMSRFEAKVEDAGYKSVSAEKKYAKKREKPEEISPDIVKDIDENKIVMKDLDPNSVKSFIEEFITAFGKNTKKFVKTLGDQPTATREAGKAGMKELIKTLDKLLTRPDLKEDERKDLEKRRENVLMARAAFETDLNVFDNVSQKVEFLGRDKAFDFDNTTDILKPVDLQDEQIVGALRPEHVQKIIDKGSREQREAIINNVRRLSDDTLRFLKNYPVFVRERERRNLEI